MKYRILSGFLALVLLCTVAAGAAPVRAASSASIQEQIQELEEKRKEEQKQIDALESQKSQVLLEIDDIVVQRRLLDTQSQLLYQQQMGIQQQITLCNQLIADRQQELDMARSRLNDLNERFKLRIRAMEENGSISYWEVLFSASSFIDFLDKLNMIREIASADQRHLEQIQKAAAEVEAAQAALMVERVSLEKTNLELQDNQKQLEQKRSESQALLDRLLVRRDEYEAYIEQSKDAADALDKLISKKEDEYAEALENERFQQWLASQTPGANAPAGGNVDANGIYWVMPVKYTRLTSPFNPNRLHPILGYVRPHTGVDLAASRWTPIYATRSGLVTMATVTLEGGNCVMINHGDEFASGYLHMEQYIVYEGQWVTAGQIIGYVGDSGLSQGCHLHFNVFKNGKYVNPADYLNFY